MKGLLIARSRLEKWWLNSFEAKEIKKGMKLQKSNNTLQYNPKNQTQDNHLV